ELAKTIFWVEEFRLGVQYLSVVQAAVDKILGFFLFTQRTGYLAQAPLIIYRTQCNGNRLPSFPRMYFRYRFFFARRKGREIAVVFIELIEHPGRFGQPWCECFLRNSSLSRFISFFAVEVTQA